MTTNVGYMSRASLDNMVIVKTSADFGVLDSTKEYFIDGVIDLTGVTLTVPAGGVYIRGYNNEISQLVCADNTYTMFTGATSGNVFFYDFGIEVSGTSSQVFDLVSNTGNEAVELSGVNFNNCTSRGELTNFRQGRESNSGYFGGSPALILSGAMSGGYVFRDSIVRGLSDVWTGALFEEGTGLTIASRFFSDANIDLGSLCSFIDFVPANFTNSSSVQLKDMFITRNGVNDATDTNIIPNMAAADLVSIWRTNQGIPNTYVGGTSALSTEATTTVTGTVGLYYTALGTWTNSDLQHFDSPSNGQWRNLGSSPRNFKIVTYLVIDGGANDVLNVRVRKFEDSTSTTTTVISQQATVNNFQGGADRCTFSILGKTTLDVNDYIFLEVANTTDNTNFTVKLGSFLTVEER